MFATHSITCLFLHCSGDHPNLHSFPTRRSSDLARHVLAVDDLRVDHRRAADRVEVRARVRGRAGDRKSTRLNSSHVEISYAVFCLKKKKNKLTISLMLPSLAEGLSQWSAPVGRL